MVSAMEAYAILNKSVLNVINDLVILDTVEFDEKPYQVRLEEATIKVGETRERLNTTVVIGHNLEQYVNKFYSIFLDSSEIILLDYLININHEDIDLTEFGDFI